VDPIMHGQAESTYNDTGSSWRERLADRAVAAALGGLACFFTHLRGLVLSYQ
jgi:hypothetical protein